MSKAKEYRDRVKKDLLEISDSELSNVIVKVINKSNHKTLEDVKDWIKEHPIILTKQLNLDTPKEISKWLMALANLLEKLKL